VGYQSEKWVWTEADFDRMGWHDATIYAVQFGKDISFDIDYIFEWVHADEDNFFSFVVAPVTLVSLEPTSVVFNVDCRFGQELTIEHIHRRLTEVGATEWYLETHQGDITITTDSFRQVVRRPRCKPANRYHLKSTANLASGKCRKRGLWFRPR
jgi:hypothetical protein